MKTLNLKVYWTSSIHIFDIRQSTYMYVRNFDTISKPVIHNFNKCTFMPNFTGFAGRYCLKLKRPL